MSQLHQEVMLEKVNYLVKDHPSSHTTKYDMKVPSLYKFYIFFFSIIASLLTVAVPFFADTANSIQSQNLYIGMMLTKGQIPYSDLFTTGGFLFFVLIALSYHLGTTVWLVLVQALCFYLTGVYFYKLIHYVTGIQKVALGFTAIYYLFSISLGFGGLYAIQLALPFVLVSLWFLTKYFAGLVKDEAFILFGFAAAIAMLIEPRTLLFWLLACIAIIAYNVSQKHFARGFYQLLAAIFGMLLVFYTAGYFILNLQILSPYLEQALVYPFSYFVTGDLSLILGLTVQLGLVLGLGLLTGLLTFMKQPKLESDLAMKWLLVFVVFSYAGIAAISHDFHTYHLLPLLPYALILLSSSVGRQYEAGLRTVSHRRRKGKNGARRVIAIYLNKHFYVPAIIMLGAVFGTAYQYVTSSAINQERSQIAHYLRQRLAEDQPIYVWDDTSKIYLETQAKSASQFASPFVNLKKESHQQMLEDELLQNKASYIVVNKQKALPKAVKKIVTANYKIDRKIDVKGFSLYQKK
ncbi:membrane protein [Streptococcus equi subsp. equi]|uniref:Membrane protein n=1 Tax=Streptococcus equi subsp. equi TaxID=148942 RepID=A0A380JWQ0_9STRE|nr:membrane protein [Streptococcus equi subsp. equi]